MSSGQLPAIAMIGADSLVRDLGGDVQAIAARANFPMAGFSNPDLPVPLNAATTFLEIAARECGCPDFGLRLVQRQDLSVVGPLYLLMTLTPTLGDAMIMLARYLRLHSTGLFVNTSPAPEGMLIEYDVGYLDASHDRQGVELGMGLGANFLRRHALPDWHPVYVQFRYARPATLREHLSVFGPNLLFNQDRNAMCIDAQTLAIPIRQNPPDARRIAAKMLRQQDAFNLSGIASRSEAVIRSRLPYGVDCSIDAVAEILGLSVRSLQRSLAQAGTSFDVMRDSVRADLARKYLLQSNMSVAEIADVLGYSQPSAFTRSFRRWYQCAPLAYRRTARDSGG